LQKRTLIETLCVAMVLMIACSTVSEVMAASLWASAGNGAQTRFRIGQRVYFVGSGFEPGKQYYVWFINWWSRGPVGPDRSVTAKPNGSVYFDRVFYIPGVYQVKVTPIAGQRGYSASLLILVLL